MIHHVFYYWSTIWSVLKEECFYLGGEHMFERKKIATAVQVALGLAVVATPAQTVFAADDAVLEEIVVTGSRIKRTEHFNNSQLVSMDRVEIDALGSLTVADVLRSSPLNTYGSFNERSGSSAQSNAVVDLRGLGSTRTLVMLNGRRMAGSPSLGASSININMIPMAAVDRLDIMADGGSAVYGSDAVAGVVNMQMRQNFEGFELQVLTGDRAEDDGTEEGMAIIVGAGNDKGNVTFVAEYSRRDPIWDRDRDYTAPWAIDKNGNGVIDAYVDTDGYSIYGNSIAIYDPNTGYDNIQAGNSCQADAVWLGKVDSDLDWYPSQPGSTYCMYGYANASANKAGLDKKSSYASFDYQLVDNVQVFGTALFSTVDSFGRYAPPAAAWRNMPADYKEVPYDIPALLADGTITEDYRLTGYYRWTNIGTRDNSIKDTQYDLVAGLRGNVTDNVSYEVYAQRSRYDVKDLGYYYLSYPGLDYVLNNGIDPFSAAGAGAMSAATIQDNFSTLDKYYGQLQFNDVGDWFGAGSVTALAGAEYFESAYSNQYDRASEAGFVGGSAGNSSAGYRDVTAFFAEAVIPVLDSVEVNAAIRYDDYSDFGSEVSPSLSGTWRVTDTINVRGRWSQGFRAPGLDQLYGPETFSAEDATDYARCALGGIAPDDCSSGQVDTYYSTNPNLGAETSQTFSVGGNWMFVDDWSLDLGWWRVEVEDTISQSTTQSVFYAEAAGIQFNPSTGTYVDRTNARPIVYSSYTNAGELNVEGIDIALKGMIETGVGQFGVNAMWAHNLSYEQTAYYRGPTQETKGYFVQPEDRAQIVLTWSWNNHNVDFVTDYIGDYSQADFIEIDSAGNAKLKTSNQKLDSWTTFNASYSYDAQQYGLIKIGARNLTNEEPVLDKSDKFDRALYNLYDPTGRVVYAEYKLRF